jgi:uncharacterized lipoprotein NlpE involved in copper resistance
MVVFFFPDFYIFVIGEYMNKKTFLVSLLMTILIILGFGSCLSTKGLDDAHNAKNSLDWAGVYTGTIPSGSGPGINAMLRLNPDQSFLLRYEYIDRSSIPYDWTGSFQWDKKGNTIILDADNVPPYYKVAENKLIQLDMKGKPIKGSLADNYVLNKER